MKKSSFVVIFALLLSLASPLVADEVDTALPSHTSERLKTATRNMIQDGIDQEAALTMTRTMAAKGFSENNMIKAQELVRNTHQANLPVEPVMNKAYEGMSKNIEPDRILNAMEKVRSRYAYAYEHARKLSQDEEEIDTTGTLLAQSMSAGLKQVDADRLLEQLTQRIRTKNQVQDSDLCEKTLLLTRDMLRLGASSSQGTRVVMNALQNRFSAQEMEQIRYAFMHQSRFQAPDDLANQYAHRIRNGMPADEVGGSGSMSENANQAGKPEGSGSGGSQGMEGNQGDSAGSGGSQSGGGSEGSAGSGGDSPGSGGSGGSGSSSGSSGSGGSGGSEGSSGSSGSGGSGGSEGSGGSGGGSGSGKK